MKTIHALAGPSRTRVKNWPIEGLAAAAGTLLVWMSAGIHLRLYALGYDQIAVIGRLFLVQGVVGSLIGLLVVWTRHLVTYVFGAGYMIASVGGFLTSLWFGLFGFRDSLAAPYAGAAMAVEVAGAVLFMAAAGSRLAGHGGQVFGHR